MYVCTYIYIYIHTVLQYIILYCAGPQKGRRASSDAAATTAATTANTNDDNNTATNNHNCNNSSSSTTTTNTNTTPTATRYEEFTRLAQNTLYYNRIA